MTDDIRCLFYTDGKQCEGMLERTSRETTSMGIFNGVDTNNITEYFACRECGRRFTRKWSWERFPYAGTPRSRGTALSPAPEEE